MTFLTNVRKMAGPVRNATRGHGLRCDYGSLSTSCAQSGRPLAGALGTQALQKSTSKCSCADTTLRFSAGLADERFIEDNTSVTLDASGEVRPREASTA
jgi:hypothetical protein